MKPVIYILLLSLATTGSSHAAETQPCVDYRPSADVEYQPGVDARGNEVAPADLASSGLTHEQVLNNASVDLELPLSGYVDISPYGADLSQAHVNAGSVWLHQGRAELNDQPLQPNPCASAPALKAPPSPQKPREKDELGS